LAAGAAAVFTAGAMALYTCGQGSGTYSNNEWASLGLAHVIRSDWSSDKAYNAYRIDASGSATYQKYISSGYWTFSNSVDAFRRTAMQRGGYTVATWSMSQYSQNGC
jgi:hypothetical protein